MAKKDVLEKYVRKNSLLLYNIAAIRPNSIKNISLAIRQGRLDILETYVTQAPEKYQTEARYTKISCLDEIILKDYHRFEHLNKIRNVVKFDKIADEIVGDREYKRAMQLYYMKELLMVLKLNPKENCWVYLWKQKEKITEKVIHQIDEYYIRKITS